MLSFPTSSKYFFLIIWYCSCIIREYLSLFITFLMDFFNSTWGLILVGIHLVRILPESFFVLLFWKNTEVLYFSTTEPYRISVNYNYLPMRSLVRRKKTVILLLITFLMYFFRKKSTQLSKNITNVLIQKLMLYIIMLNSLKLN